MHISPNENRGQRTLPPDRCSHVLLRGDLLLAVAEAIDRAVPVVGDSIEPSFICITSTGRPTYLLSSRKPVTNGSIDS